MAVFGAGNVRRRRVRWLLAVAALTATTAAIAPMRLDPGVSFRISASTKVYAGDTPSAQDDEVMRGRGVAVNGRARIEFLTFTPAPSGLTTDDFLVAADSGRTSQSSDAGRIGGAPCGWPYWATLGRTASASEISGPGLRATAFPVRRQHAPPHLPMRLVPQWRLCSRAIGVAAAGSRSPPSDEPSRGSVSWLRRHSLSCGNVAPAR